MQICSFGVKYFNFASPEVEVATDGRTDVNVGHCLTGVNRDKQGPSLLAPPLALGAAALLCPSVDKIRVSLR